MDSPSLSDSETDKDDFDWLEELQANRLLIANHIDYNKLAPALQSALIIDREDDELIKNPFQNPTSTSRANVLVDLLLRKGKQNYVKFLNVLGSYYPDVYTGITNCDPPPAARESISVVEFSDEVLSFIFAKLSEKKQECGDLLRDNQSLQTKLKENSAIIQKLEREMEDFSKREESHRLLEKEIDDYRQVAEHFKSENYKVCMRLLQANDDNAKLREENMNLRLDIDKQNQNMRLLENSIHTERSHSIRLRRKIDTGPTEKEVLELQKQIGDLRLRAVHAHESESFSGKDTDTKVEILQHDLRTISEHYEESNREMSKLREELEKSEELRIKYYEEIQHFQRQFTALNDDCVMYKNRRDAVWQQLQEVEKERDQLMKERNEAQLTAQTYMEEKTKYRYAMRHMEEKHDIIADQLKQKENKIIDMKNQMEGNQKTTAGLDLLQDLPSSDEDRRHSICSSVVSFDSNTGEPRRRRIGERRQRFRASEESDNTREKRQRSLTSYIRENIFHKLVEADGAIHSVKVSGKTLQSVELAGGNETGIFIHKVYAGSYAEVIGLSTGMKILKIEMGDNNIREVRFQNCTLENAFNLFQEFEDTTVKVTVQYLENEYQEVVTRSASRRCSGDSFYVRANYGLKNKEGYLNFEKGSVMHVVNTCCSNSKDWHAYLVDLNSGEDGGKVGRIPSYRYHVSSGQFSKASQLQAKPQMYFQRLYNASPYTVVKKAPVKKVEYRPCVFVPTNLSTVLCYKLTTMTTPHEFDFPVPKSVKCDEQEAHRRVVSTEALSCNMIGTEMHEFVTTDAVKSIMQKGKHCILTYNEKCTSLETFNMMLHMKGIYPIVIHISSEKEKNLKILLDPDKENDNQSIFQQIKRDQALLDKYVPRYVTINADKCNRLEDVVQQVMDHVSQESNKIIWISGKSDVHI